MKLVIGEGPTEENWQMHFLETIEGRRGEELASAVLKYLLINSAVLRERFASHLAAHLPPSFVPTFRDGIICQTEVATEGKESGRIDLLVREEGGVVFGIENKFWAGFTTDQPKKYVESLKKYVSKSGAPYKLVVLAPQERRTEIVEHLGQQGIQSEAALLDWQEVLIDLKDVMDRDLGETAVVASFLHEYATRQVSSSRIDVNGQYVVGERVNLGNAFQYDVLYRLKSIFASPGRLSTGKSWVGFWFGLQDGDQADGSDAPAYSVRPWFGFCKSDKTGHVDIGIHIQNSRQRFDPPSDAKGVRFDDIERLPEGTGADWMAIPLVYEKRTVPQWKEILEPLISSLREAFVKGDD